MRSELESRLEKIVRDNRFTISVIFPLVGAISLIASSEGLLPSYLSFNPYFILFGVLIMRSPLISGILPLLRRKELTGLALVCIYAYLIEFIGVSTGFPYGNFQYLIELGPMIAGKVPLGLPVFFLPLVLNAYLLSILILGDKSSKFLYRFPLVVSLVIIIDLVLDPGAVAVKFWEYENGIYYGVPLSNYFGWVLSSTVAAGIFDQSFNIMELREKLSDCEYLLDDMISFVILWSIVAAFYSLWIPLVLGIALGLSLYLKGRFDFPTPDLDYFR